MGLLTVACISSRVLCEDCASIWKCLKSAAYTDRQLEGRLMPLRPNGMELMAPMALLLEIAAAAVLADRATSTRDLEQIGTQGNQICKLAVSFVVVQYQLNTICY